MLIRARAHAVPSKPFTAVGFVPNRGVAGLACDLVAAHLREAVALARPFGELGLVLGCGQVVVSLRPGCSASELIYPRGFRLP